MIGLAVAAGLVLAAPAVDRALTAGAAGVPVAFMVGMVSFFTPCVLPLVPGYLSFVSGLSGESLEAGVGRRRVLLGTTLFVLGFATVFTALGATASALAGFLYDNITWFNRVAGVIVIVMGLSFLIPGALKFLEREHRPLLGKLNKSGIAGAFPLGFAFAVGWTPCVGPGLGTILTLAGGGSVGQGAILLFSFSLGFGMWFVLGGLAFRRATTALGWLRRRQRILQTVGGAFLLTIGVLLVTDKWLEVMAPVRRWLGNFSAPI